MNVCKHLVYSYLWHYRMIIEIAAFISTHRMNCYVICFFYYTCNFIWEETYISNITSFPALSVFMSTNV